MVSAEARVERADRDGPLRVGIIGELRVMRTSKAAARTPAPTATRTHPESRPGKPGSTQPGRSGRASTPQSARTWTQKSTGKAPDRLGTVEDRAGSVRDCALIIQIWMARTFICIQTGAAPDGVDDHGGRGRYLSSRTSWRWPCPRKTGQQRVAGAYRCLRMSTDWVAAAHGVAGRGQASVRGVPGWIASARSSNGLQRRGSVISRASLMAAAAAALSCRPSRYSAWSSSP